MCLCQEFFCPFLHSHSQQCGKIWRIVKRRHFSISILLKSACSNYRSPCKEGLLTSNLINLEYVFVNSIILQFVYYLICVRQQLQMSTPTHINHSSSYLTTWLTRLLDSLIMKTSSILPIMVRNAIFCLMMMLHSNDILMHLSIHWFFKLPDDVFVKDTFC